MLSLGPLLPGQAVAAQELNCAPAQQFDVTFEAGSRWRGCLELADQEGLQLVDARLTLPGGSEHRVVDRLGLAQIEVVFHDDRSREGLLSAAGLASGALTLRAEDCAGGSLMAQNAPGGAQANACHRVQWRGPMLQYYGSERQGEWLELWSASQLAGRTWVVRFRLHDDGVIEPALGSGGLLTETGSDSTAGWPIDAVGTIGVASTVSSWWRIDLDLGTSGADDTVEELELEPNLDRELYTRQLDAWTSEAFATVDLERKRSWRLLDGGQDNSEGHARSYHLEPLAVGHRFVGLAAEPWTEAAFWATVETSCERLAFGNSTVGGCGASLPDYIDAGDLENGDPVLWYKLSWHHLPRDESAYREPIDWYGYTLLPRDWTYENPFDPTRRQGEP